jgi:hypothetical protein
MKIDLLKDIIIDKLRQSNELMLLLNDTSLTAKEGNIYKKWISAISPEFITFPCLTVTLEGGGENRLRIGEVVRLRIDAWENLEDNYSQKILDLVDEIINKQSFVCGNINILDIIKTYEADDCNFINNKNHSYRIYKINIM